MDYQDNFKVWKRAGIKRIELALCNSSGDSHYLARWVCKLNRSGLTINLGMMSCHPFHTQDDVNIRRLERYQASKEYKSVNMDFIAITYLRSLPFGSRSLNYHRGGPLTECGVMQTSIALGYK